MILSIMMYIQRSAMDFSLVIRSKTAIVLLILIHAKLFKLIDNTIMDQVFRVHLYGSIGLELTQNERILHLFVFMSKNFHTRLCGLLPHLILSMFIGLAEYF